MTMTLNLPVGYFHAQLFFTGAAAPTGAAITFAGKDDLSSTSPAAIAGIIATAWGTNMDAQTSNNLTLATVRVKKGPMDDGPFGVVNPANVGGLSGASVAPNLSILVRKNSAAGGKKGSGRLYFPGLPEASVDEGGIITPAVVTAQQTAWSAFHLALDTAQVPMHLAHNFGTYTNVHGELVTVAARVPDEVTSLSVDNKAATQRRRLRR